MFQSRIEGEIPCELQTFAAKIGKAAIQVLFKALFPQPTWPATFIDCASQLGHEKPRSTATSNEFTKASVWQTAGRAPSQD